MEASGGHGFKVENFLRNLLREEFSNLVEVHNSISKILTSLLAPLEELFKVSFDRRS